MDRYPAPMPELSDSRRKVFAFVAWATVGYSVFVILFGTFVRATGSGDGCGETWPKCGDFFIPQSAGAEMVIEFTHRATSALAGVLVISLIVMALRWFDRGSPTRRAALLAVVLVVVEGLLGAALVLFGWVDADVSLGRTIVVPLHLVNTFLLLAALTLTAWWGSGHATPRRSLRSHDGRWLLLGAAILVLIGTSGALNALADTVFPSESVVGGLAAKFGPTAPVLSKLRILHPLIAVLGGLTVAWIAMRRSRGSSEQAQRVSGILTVVVLTQMFVGIANVFFLTPLATQVLHLLVADALWIIFVIFGAVILAQPSMVPDPVTEPV